MSTCCRLCLTTQGQFILIFSEDPLNVSRSCAGLIFFTTGIKVLSTDDLPRHVCDKCLELMYGYCNFKKQSTENNRILQESSKRQKPKENLLVQAKRRYTSLFRNRPPTSKQLPLEPVKPLTQKPLPTGIKPIPPTNNRILIESVVSLQPHQAEDVPEQSMASFLENYQPVPDTCRDPLDLNTEIYEDSKCNIPIDVKNESVLPTITNQPEPQPSIAEQLPLHQPVVLPIDVKNVSVLPTITNQPQRELQPSIAKQLPLHQPVVLPSIVKSEVPDEIPTFSLPNDADISDFLEITMDGIETTISIDSLPLVSVENKQILIPPITKSTPTNPPKHSFGSFNHGVSPSKVLVNNIVRKYNSIVSKPVETSVPERTVETETIEDHLGEDSCLLTKFEKEWLKRRKQMQEKERKINKVRNENEGNKYPSKMKVNNVPIKVSPIIVPSVERLEPVIETIGDKKSCNEDEKIYRPVSNVMKVPTGGVVKGAGLLNRNSQIVSANITATNPTFLTVNKTATNPKPVSANKTRTKPTQQKRSTPSNPTTEDYNVTFPEKDGRNDTVQSKSSDLEKNLSNPFKLKPCMAKKMYRCAECDFACTEYSSLVEHIHVHDSVREFYCKIRACGRSFSSQDLLDTHNFFNDHTPELLLCYKCGVTPVNFSKHMSWHHRKEVPLEKTFVCHDCGDKYDTKPKLCTHIRNKHLPVNAKKKKVFTCELCYATLSSKLGVVKHNKRVHTPHANQVVCLLCSKAFQHKDQLVRHMRSHTGEAPFDCKYNCGKSFTMNWNRIQHERLHTGEKPYKCVAPGCEEAFRHNVTRKIHHRKHHKDVPLLEPKPSNFHRPKKIGLREKE